MDPAALEAARKADEKAPPRSTDEFQRAASQLFEDDEDDGEDEEPTITFPGRSKARPAVPRPLAAKQEPKQDAIHNRSLAMIERAERRHRRKAIAAVAVIALLVLVGAAVLLGLTRGCTVKAPAYKSYGTEQFDTQAQAYLKSAAAENEKIIGYLAFPGQNGQLVYSGSQPGDGAAISGTNYLNASMPSNTVLSCADASLASLTDQTNFSQNAEFTLYLSDVTYHSVLWQCIIPMPQAPRMPLPPPAMGNFRIITAMRSSARALRNAACLIPAIPPVIRKPS